MTSPDVAESIRWAEFYRSHGWNPIPSDPRLGYPPFPYSKAKDGGLSAESFERLASRGWTSIQLATGVRWGLCAIDVDGEVARDAWRDWTRFRPMPATWTVRTPRDGLHLWYTLDRNGSSRPRQFLWRLADPSRPDGWARHEAIELIGDGWLLRAVPSVRIGDDGEVRRYEWLVGPDDLSSPAELPTWISNMQACSVKSPYSRYGATLCGDGRFFDPSVANAPRAKCGRLVRSGEYWSRSDVLAAISDKAGLARSWGLRIVGDHLGATGWVACRAIGREDRRPSAGFSPSTGRYWEPELGRMPVGLFDLAVSLGVYPTWQEAVDDLGERYHVTPARIRHAHPHACPRPISQQDSSPSVNRRPMELNSIRARERARAREDLASRAAPECRFQAG